MENNDNPHTIGQLNGKWAVLLKIQLSLLPVVAAVVAYNFVLLVGLNIRTSVIEGNRFTAADALKMEQRIDKRFDELPPRWFVERMDRVEDRIDKLEERLSLKELGALP